MVAAVRDRAGAGWSAVRVAGTGPGLTISLSIPVTVAVGEYRLSVEVWQEGGPPPARHSAPVSLYVLFNAGHSRDPAYLPDTAARAEFVDRQAGQVVHFNIDTTNPSCSNSEFITLLSF